MSLLAGALTPDAVTDVPDDAAGLRSAASRLADASDAMLSEAVSAQHSWSALPSVLSADALTPVLAPLLEPAVVRARALQSAADAILRISAGAATDIEDLKRERDTLVQRIDEFRASAPGRVAAHVASQVSSGDLLGAAATVVTSWQQVPSLVADEAVLRWQVGAHDDRVTSTLGRIAAELDAVAVPGADAAPVSAQTVHPSMAKSHPWYEDAWHQVQKTAASGWKDVEDATGHVVPYLQDAAGYVGNAAASFANAVVQHPDEFATLIGGLALTAAGDAVEGGGVALDLTGVGAVVGVPANVLGAGMIAAGGTAAVAGGSSLGIHAMTDDSEAPYSTDHAREPNENHPGRSNDGTYRKSGNDEARASADEKEAQGVKAYEKRSGLEVDTSKVKARVDGVDNGRFYDGLAKKPDGTYIGLEVKSGTASRDAQQRAFDDAVSPSNPAHATLPNGETIDITSVEVERVK